MKCAIGKSWRAWYWKTSGMSRATPNSPRDFLRTCLPVQNRRLPVFRECITAWKTGFAYHGGDYARKVSRIAAALGKQAGKRPVLELVSRELLDGFVEYTLLYDMIVNRIPISEVCVEHGKMRLMQNTDWEFDSLPHMLIAGGTGGGKTYFILTLIRALLQTNAVLYILDPKTQI